MKRTVLRYGLFSGLAILALFLLEFLLFSKDNYSAREVFGYTSIVLSTVFVFFGIRHYRDKVNGGQLSFGRGMKVGVLIILIPSLVFGLFNLVYVEVINPGFMDEYYQYQLGKMQQTMSPTEFQAARSKIESEKEMFSNPVFSSAVMFFTVFVIGVIITVISSLVLRRNVAR